MVMTFDVDPTNRQPTVAEVLDSMQDYLSQFRMKPVEANHAMLMFEESLLSLLDHADPERPQRITVKARRLGAGGRRLGGPDAPQSSVAGS